MPKAKSDKPSIETFTRLIENKREGNEFTDEEIRTIVDAILDEEMPVSTSCMGNGDLFSGYVSSRNS